MGHAGVRLHTGAPGATHMVRTLPPEPQARPLDQRQPATPRHSSDAKEETPPVCMHLVARLGCVVFLPPPPSPSLRLAGKGP